MKRRSGTQKIRFVIRWALFVLVLGFVIYALGKQIVQIDWRTVQFRIAPLVAAAVCLLLVAPVQLLSYRTLLAAYARVPPLPAMAAIAWIPPLGKYVPGKIASIVGAVYLLKRFQIPTAIAMGVVLVMDGLAVLSGLISGSPLLLWEPVRRVLPQAWLWCAGVVTVGIIALHPTVFARILNWVLCRTGREPLQQMPDLRHYTVPVLCGFAQWILAGAALWLIANSLTPVPVARVPLFIAIAALGYTISYLMLFAPGGLGPREAIFQLALSSVIAAPGLSAATVVTMRIVQTLTELLAAMTGAYLLRHVEERPPTMPQVVSGD